MCSVAVGNTKKTFMHSVRAARQHNELILGMIDELLQSALIARGQLNYVAFSAGPGSFTGVRLGAAVAQGIALGLGLKVIAVPTSQAFANQIHSMNPSIQTCSIARHSHRGWVYFSQFRFDRSNCICTQRDELFEYSALPLDTNVISDNDLSINAQPILEFALNNISTCVEPELSHPVYVEGDTPYVPAKR